MKVTEVPERYLLPGDTEITVQAIKTMQKFIIPLERLGSITVRKYDSKGKSLSGVTFTLSNTAGEEVMTKTTDSDGKVTFIDQNQLMPGNYIVTETKTVPGQTLLPEPIRVTIPMTMTDAEVERQKADKEKGLHNEKDGVWHFYDLTFAVRNNAVFTMPTAGGHNILIWIAGTVGLTGIAAAIWLLRRKTFTH